MITIVLMIVNLKTQRNMERGFVEDSVDQCRRRKIKEKLEKATSQGKRIGNGRNIQGAHEQINL